MRWVEDLMTSRSGDVFGMPKSGWLRETERKGAGLSYLWAGGLCAVMSKAAALFADASVEKSPG